MKRRLMKRRVQLGFLAAVVVSALIAGSIWLNPASIKDELGFVQSGLTIVAIVVGGAFAIFKFQLFRDFEPHLSISQDVSHRFIGDEYVHIAVISTLNNNSRVRVELKRGFFRVQKILPVTDKEVERLYAQVFSDKEYEDIQWPTLDEFPASLAQGQIHRGAGRVTSRDIRVHNILGNRGSPSVHVLL